MIRMIELGSITLPAISSRMLTTSRKAIGPKPCPISQSAIACGMFSLVIRKLNSTALVMM